MSITDIKEKLKKNPNTKMLLSLDFDGIKKDYCYGKTIKVDNPSERLPDFNNLFLWYKLDEGSGTTAYDSSDYGHDGTLYDFSNPSSSTWIQTVISPNSKVALTKPSTQSGTTNAKIYTPNKKGTFSERYDEVSLRMKKKYGA